LTVNFAYAKNYKEVNCKGEMTKIEKIVAAPFIVSIKE